MQPCALPHRTHFVQLYGLTHQGWPLSPGILLNSTQPESVRCLRSVATCSRVLQVLDRAIFSRGTKQQWRTAVLRAHVQSAFHRAHWRDPLSLLGLSLRGTTAQAPHTDTVSIPAARSPASFNVCMDVPSLSLRSSAADDSAGDALDGNHAAPPAQSGLLQRLQLQRVPPSTATFRKDLDTGREVRLAGHLNRQMGTSAGWQQVRMAMRWPAASAVHSAWPHSFCVHKLAAHVALAASAMM